MGLRETTKIEKTSKAFLASETSSTYESVPHCGLTAPSFASTSKFDNNSRFISKVSDFLSLFDKRFEEIAIMSVGWCYLDRDGERRLSVGNNSMDFVTVEKEIGLFNAYFGILVGLKSFDVCGDYGKGEFLIEGDNSSLSY